MLIAKYQPEALILYLQPNMEVKMARAKSALREVKKFDKLDTKFGLVTVLERKQGKIMVLIDDDITATFNENEFFSDFVL